ncbi:MAG: hypothetical protein KGJ92_04380 [Actinomycetales bacterium]|nr:hypothetical protein [Actinomycetales bacterium]
MGPDERDERADAAAELRRRYDDEAEEFGGDPVCWIQFVCPSCGSIVEGPQHELTCRAR